MSSRDERKWYSTGEIFEQEHKIKEMAKRENELADKIEGKIAGSHEYVEAMRRWSDYRAKVNAERRLLVDMRRAHKS